MNEQATFEHAHIFQGAPGFSRPRFGKQWLGKQILVSVMVIAFLFATWPANLPAYQDQSVQPPPQEEQTPPSGQAAPPQYKTQTREKLQQLVAPIALYPDSLVAQILAASTFPDQVVEADRWVQANPNLKDKALADAVDKQPWDASVKALTAFPTVLANMDKNISWTSSLGDAYYNQQQDVMDSIQVMRQKAEKAGNLKTTEQQKVTDQGSNVVIEPANPEVVYVPAYDPWAVYGYPITPWPFWYETPGIWFGGPFLSFGVGFGIGFFGGFGWGWGHWGFDWGHHYVTFNHGRYFSGSRTFYNRASYYRGGGYRGVNRNVRGGGFAGRGGGAGGRAFNGDSHAARGFGSARGQTGTRSGAFSGFNHGGDTRSFSSRGRSSFGGGGFHGGGGSHGGGGGRH